MRSGERRIGEPMTKMVEGEFGLRQQVRPAIRRERDVSRRQDRDKMVLGCTYCTLSRKRSVVIRGDVLISD